MHTQATRTKNTRDDGRHTIGAFVAPGTQASAMEGFMVADLSREGMSLLRVARKRGEQAPAPAKTHEAREQRRGLDYRFSWLAVPLPERGAHVCVLTEVVHRRRFGPLEMLGVRFERMSDADRALLDDYLSERDHLSFGAAQVRQRGLIPL